MNKDLKTKSYKRRKPKATTPQNQLQKKKSIKKQPQGNTEENQKRKHFKTQNIPSTSRKHKTQKKNKSQNPPGTNKNRFIIFISYALVMSMTWPACKAARVKCCHQWCAAIAPLVKKRSSCRFERPNCHCHHLRFTEVLRSVKPQNKDDTSSGDLPVALINLLGISPWNMSRTSAVCWGILRKGPSCRRRGLVENSSASSRIIHHHERICIRSNADLWKLPTRCP